MTITILIDNALPPDRNLVAEHGLSLYIDTGEKKILCDTGASGQFADNAKMLGIDIARCDFVFISHGHDDHCGGLWRFLEADGEGKVYMHQTILHERYYSSRRDVKRDISCDKEILEANMERIVPISSSIKITDGIYAVRCKCNRFSKPYGNKFLTKSDGLTETFDDFGHETALVFTTPKGLVIISPCSHNGVMNIMHDCCMAAGCSKVHAFIGGFHFVEGDGCIKEAEAFADSIESLYPDTLFYTGHCTCDTAKGVLAGKLKNITFFATGTKIDI